jgi:hypothetical protein
MGEEDPVRMRSALEAVKRSGRNAAKKPPSVDGVPRLRARVESAAQLPAVVRRYLPEIEKDPSLLALSLVDPLRLVNRLGIAIAPAAAQNVRRALAGKFTFDLGSLDEHGRLRGIGPIKWRPRTEGRR